MSGKRDPLLRSQVGKKACTTWQSPTGLNLKLCVEGKRYGFAANLVAKSGKDMLPVPTSYRGQEAKTLSEAIKNAKRFLDGVAQKQN